MSSRALTSGFLALAAFAACNIDNAPGGNVDELKKRIEAISTDGSSPRTDDELAKARRMLSDDVRERRKAANLADLEAWRKIASKEEWEKFRDGRIDALRKSLGQFPPEKSDLKLKVVATLPGDGFQIENIVFESRPGLVVTANLYSPAGDGGEPAAASRPGIIICHSHHRPKIDGELQDMGMNFARAGCVVLVMDQLGHGERQQHPFRTEKDFAGKFRPSRQDYYFRYNLGMQLHLIGESLVGWMAWDMMRGVDVLLSRPTVDKDRIILLGSVAGGGDPAAVTAALDPRIAAVAPFNFGGPQPETVFPLPEDAETAFNYMGGGSWESTRNLRLSGSGGFFPWLIVGSVAPRKLIYSHEFSWDRDNDPVWKRYEKIYGWYGAGDSLGFAHGYGKLQQDSSVASHCNHIGPPHRKMIYPLLERWFGIPAPKEEYRNRRNSSDLTCLTSDAAKGIEMKHARQIALRMADARAAEFRKSLEPAPEAIAEPPRPSVETLKTAWRSRLGQIDSPGGFSVTEKNKSDGPAPRVERVEMLVERKITVPALFLLPETKPDQKLPVVVAFGQGGRDGFLKHRSERLAELLQAGVAVCLIDVRGTGETASGTSRGRSSEATSVSSAELMLGQTLVGSQLKDLRAILEHLRSRPDIDPKRIALWGDSFAPMNASETRVNVPLDAEPQPSIGEPLGHVLALLGGLYEPDVAAVVSGRGGLAGFRSALQSLYLCIPHDLLVPGCLDIGDLDDVGAAIAPRPIWIGGMIDARNRPAEPPGKEGQRPLLPRTTAKAAGTPGAVVIRPDAEPGAEMTKWLIEKLKP